MIIRHVSSEQLNPWPRDLEPVERLTFEEFDQGIDATAKMLFGARLAKDDDAVAYGQDIMRRTIADHPDFHELSIVRALAESSLGNTGLRIVQ